MDDILTIAEYGWCNFKLGNYTGKASYIRNLPLDILKGFEEYKKYGHCIIPFDEETSQVYLIVCDNNIIITDNRNSESGFDFVSQCININADKVMFKLFDEVIHNIDKWVEWLSISDNIKTVDHIKDVFHLKINNIIKNLKIE